MIYNDELLVACRRLSEGLKASLWHTWLEFCLFHMFRGPGTDPWGTPSHHLYKSNKSKHRIPCLLTFFSFFFTKCWTQSGEYEGVSKVWLIHLCEECGLKVTTLSRRVSWHQSTSEPSSHEVVWSIKPHSLQRGVLTFFRHYSKNVKIIFFLKKKKTKTYTRGKIYCFWLAYITWTHCQVWELFKQTKCTKE